MAHPIKAAQYLYLAHIIEILRSPSDNRTDDYYRSMKRLRDVLTDCGFRKTLLAAHYPMYSPLKQDREGRICEPDQSKLKAWAETVQRVLYQEADDMRVIELNMQASKALRRLNRNKLNQPQRQLLKEAERCVECGAYRAAAVVGWNLAYDYIRHWVFDNKLCNLNDGLARVCPNKKVISLYSDFFDKDAPNERNVLDAMAHQCSGPIVGGGLHDTLVEYLGQRNKYAHASEKPASAAKTNAYIEHLIDIILAPPFA